MAKILFTWEIGSGSGHITPYLKLISQLESQGHEISFALKQLDYAQTLFKNQKVKWYQAPVSHQEHVEMIMPSNSYPKILNNAGYDGANRLAGMIAAWKNLYSLIAPDILVFDYSPTAMLAARGYPAKSIAIGTGFHLPPDKHPLPGLDAELGIKQDSDELQVAEEKVLTTINAALELNHMAAISDFPELLNSNAKILRTFAEMDHYSDRGEAQYAGILKSPPGTEPVWPEIEGPKIFAYIKPFKSLPLFLQLLGEKKYPTLIYGDRLPKDIEKKFTSETLRFVHKPLDMTAIGESADAVICNANHGTCTELLLSGIPILLLPLNYEQNMVARNVERMGAGLSAPQLRPGSMVKKLDMIVKDEKYRVAAEKFSNRYQDYSSENLTKTLLDTVESLLTETESQ